MDIRFNCPRCGQHLCVEEKGAGMRVDCPTCKGQIEVPRSTASEGSKVSVPTTLSRPPALPRIPRQHGIFYYVFWGTVSLFGTLAILFFGFIFITGAGAAFLAALSHHPPSVRNATTTAATPNLRLLTETNLPPLTATEMEQARRLITGLNSRTDEIEGITWYSPDPAHNYHSAVYLYIGRKATGQPWLRWKIRYYGDDWLFIRRYRIKIDDAEAVTVMPSKEIKRENSDGSVWETFDESADDHADILNQILAGNTTHLRLEGSEGYKDIQLGPEQLQRMRDVLLVFRSLGGTWPAS
jgi:hypothetical protein